MQRYPELRASWLVREMPTVGLVTGSEIDM
jgi:hypothetical protein